MDALPGATIAAWPFGAARQPWVVLGAAIFLTSIPVFVQAPLVRVVPWLSLVITPLWLGLGLWLRSRPKTQLWGDLLIGFTWTWLAGSLYWGWLRWEPFFHIPVEAIGLPVVLLGIPRNRGLPGNWFYLGSLFGTAMTDLYFYLVGLIPYWRSLMQVEPAMAGEIFTGALAQMQSFWGIGCAGVIVVILLLVGVLPMRSQKLHWWAFGGAVLSTILVDGLFGLAAIAASVRI